MKPIEFKLTNADITDIIDEVTRLGTEKKADYKAVIRTCLSLEEVLLNNQGFFGKDHDAVLKIKKHSDTLELNIRVKGKPYNPIKNDAEDNYMIVSSLGMEPEYAYSNGINHVSFNLNISQGGKELKTIMLSVIIGVAVGLGGQFLSGDLLDLGQTIVDAVSNAIFGLMSMAAMPVIFLCVIYGLMGSGSIATFKNNGLKVLGKFMLAMFSMLVASSIFAFLIFNLKIGGTGTEGFSINSIIETLFSIIPDNIFAPFMNGDNVKVIMIGVIFGSAALALGEKVGMVREISVQLKDICSLVMVWIGKLIPVLVVVVLIDNIWSGSIGPEMLSLWKIIAVYLITVIATILIAALGVSKETGVKLSEVIKAVLTPGMKGLVSASSMFCYSDMVDALENKLKVSSSVVNFGLPMGMAFFQPIVVLFGIFVLYFAGITNVGIDASWITSFIMICFVTSIAAPPVSGGSVSLLAIIFTSLAIPESVVAMACPLFLLMDYPNTAFRVIMLILEVAKGNKKQSSELKPPTDEIRITE